MKTALSKNNIVEFIADIFARRGADSYLGEDVTMSQHMLQAAFLAEQSAADDELIAAALLHDIGHYTSEFPEDALEKGDNNFHEEAGARFLSPYFSKRVIDCIRYHVPAKRYLCAVRDDYYNALSDASKHSLSLQGGPMHRSEVAMFSEQPHLDDILQVRIWDDAAKIVDCDTPEYSHYENILRNLTSSTRN